MAGLVAPLTRASPAVHLSVVNSSDVVRVARRIYHPAEKVFAAWLDPDKVRRFLFATPGGSMMHVEIDPRVGGQFVITERRDGEDVRHEGEYLVADAPRRLVFTLRVPKYAQDVDQVTITLAPAPDGCDLLLEQTLSPSAVDRREKIEHGWSHILDGLDAAIG